MQRRQGFRPLGMSYREGQWHKPMPLNRLSGLFFFAYFPLWPYRSQRFDSIFGALHALALSLLQSQPDPAEIQKIVLAFMAVMPILILVGLAVVIVPVWFICKKAGFSPWLSLLCAIPLGNLILLYVLAFSEWKVAPVITPNWNPPHPPTA
jgi:hypothetical protein